MHLGQLTSEIRNPNSMDLDCLDTLELVSLINQEDRQVATAITKVLPEIAKSVDLIRDAFTQGGRLIYLGAGTSGRLGVLDASECPPTFGVSDQQVIGLIAGGPSAILKAVEGAEDSPILGVDDLKKLNLTATDIVVGIAASGRTPYVIGALSYATEIGAITIAVSCNQNAPINKYANIAIAPIVGPEVLTGSTRMKAGSAQKMVLNMLSTAAMVKSGKVYGNLMVDVQATNEKLLDRQQRIVMEATGCSPQQATDTLCKAEHQCKTAIVMILTGLDKATAHRLLTKHHGFIRPAIKQEGQ